MPGFPGLLGVDNGYCNAIGVTVQTVRSRVLKQTSCTLVLHTMPPNAFFASFLVLLLASPEAAYSDEKMDALFRWVNAHNRSVRIHI